MPAERVRLPAELPFDFRALDRVAISACGTAYYAGLVAKYWFERFARLPVEIDVASEFRYRDVPLSAGGLSIFVSQSGETADTLATLRHAKEHKQHALAVVNVPSSTIARNSDAVLPTLAGPEIGVASTKAFTCQLAVLACLAIVAGRARGVLSPAQEQKLVRALIDVPRLMFKALECDAEIEALARTLGESRNMLFLGRGCSYPIALEGALKLKELSYIHAEGYAAGELKHGPIALIDDAVPVIVAAPSGPLFEKAASNVQEVVARGGRVVLLADREGIRRIGDKVWAAIELPRVHSFVAPILYAVPVQLLAYHVAVVKGSDVDQPRNLAKSVTVE